MSNFYAIETGVDPEQTRSVLRLAKRFFGSVPEHFELLARISPRYLRDFLQYNLDVSKITGLKPDFFAFLRYVTAKKQGFDYCTQNNFGQLVRMGYEGEVLERIEDFDGLPVAENQRLLAALAYKAVFSPGKFTQQDIQKVIDSGFSAEVLFWVIDHLGIFEKNWRILNAFAVKEKSSIFAKSGNR